MELFTLTRSFLREKVVDEFFSAIWTERYYGDGIVELVVPLTSKMVQMLPEGTFLGIDGSDEIMIIETTNIENKNLKLTGISLLSWLNNRFVRASALHEDRYFYLSGASVGATLWTLVYYMACQGSPYLNGTINTGITSPEQLVVPGLTLLGYDNSGSTIEVGVPYGPLYVALRNIATTYQVGIQIVLVSANDSGYVLGFRSYRGLDRTSGQIENPTVRFSPELDSLINIKELRSIAALKTRAYAFAPGNPDGLATVPGVSSLSGSYTGFDLRALLVFAEDITTDMVGGSSTNLVNILNSRALDGLNANRYVMAVDGEIVPESQFQYGAHYNLGDIVEVEGYTGVIQNARVTEYIRSQDAAGQKAYPTIEMIG